LGKFSDDRSAFDETLSHHKNHEGQEGFGYFGSNFVVFASFVVTFEFYFLLAALPRWF